MLIWKRSTPKQALLSLGILTAIVGLAAMSPNSGMFGQEPAAKKETTKEQKPVPGKESEEKEPPKKSDEKVPVKGANEKDPKKPDEKVSEERRVPRKADAEVPGRKVEEEKSKDPDPRRVNPLLKKEMKEVGDGQRPQQNPGRPLPNEKPLPRPEKPLPRPSLPRGPISGENALIEGLPEDFIDQQRQAYRRLEHQDVSFEEFLGFAKQKFAMSRDLEKNPTLRYRPAKLGKSALNIACGDAGNGDFEPPLSLNDPNVNSAQWSGGNGNVLVTGQVDFANFTAGLNSGTLNQSTAHQTIVSPGLDPFVGIQMTGPNTSIPSTVSPNAVRIGNAVNGAYAELLSKTFIVAPSEAVISFWYAVVLENPQAPPHAFSEQPAFQVRVLDNSTGSPVMVPGLVNLGNGTSGKLVANTANTFFQQFQRPPPPPPFPPLAPIVFRNWSCAQINLSTLVGKSVTVEFVTQDCSQGGHWGYAYVDDFCGTCLNSPTGDLSFDAATSSNCGKGEVCFNYTLPTAQNAAGTITGTAVITLEIYQNGHLLQTLPTSPSTLSSGSHVCFPIDPANIPGLDSSLGGFDFVSNGIFTLAPNVMPLTVGTVPDGRIAGQNNDYNILCGGGGPVTGGCCLGKENLVVNGDFELGDALPHSQYENANNPDQLDPGTYLLSKLENIGKACKNWQIPKACHGEFQGWGMLVNGRTNQPAGSTAVIWEQQLSLHEKGDYSICFRYLPLPQCCFDVPAKPFVVANTQSGPIPLTNVSDVDSGCGHLYSATFHFVGDPVTLQIVLPQDGIGDGNDLLIDNISVAQLVNVPFAVVDFSLNAGPLNGVTKDVTLTATSTSLTSPPYTWVWEMWAPGATSPTVTILGGNTATFPGLVSTPTDYIFKLKARSDCSTLSGSLQGWNFTINAPVSAKRRTVADPNPEPVDFEAIKARKLNAKK